MTDQVTLTVSTEELRDVIIEVHQNRLEIARRFPKLTLMVMSLGLQQFPPAQRTEILKSHGGEQCLQ